MRNIIVILVLLLLGFTTSAVLIPLIGLFGLIPSVIYGIAGSYFLKGKEK